MKKLHGLIDHIATEIVQEGAAIREQANMLPKTFISKAICRMAEDVENRGNRIITALEDEEEKIKG